MNSPIEVPVRNAFDQRVTGPELREAGVLAEERQEIERPIDWLVRSGDVHCHDLWAIAELRQLLALPCSFRKEVGRGDTDMGELVWFATFTPNGRLKTAARACTWVG